jgi:polygalacturonase
MATGLRFGAYAVIVWTIYGAAPVRHDLGENAVPDKSPGRRSVEPHVLPCSGLYSYYGPICLMFHCRDAVFPRRNPTKERTIMLSAPRIIATTLLCLCSLAAIQAQDTRHVTEPIFPAVCKVLPASLKSTAAGPVVGPSVADQDFISRATTAEITSIANLSECQGKAIELALGSNTRNAFLINPISFPAHVSLIIDGGVTVYASRNPVNYQISTSTLVCGTLSEIGTDNATSGPCEPLLTFQADDHAEADSGLYGYGVLDGQGQLPMLFSAPPPNITVPGCSFPNNPIAPGWWDLINAKNRCKDTTLVNENSPFMVSAGASGANGANNFTLYKVTIRNPPFHNVNMGGDGLTVWGVHIQAPWNVPNTDGLNLNGTNISVYDTTVANGDDDLTLDTKGSNTSNVTVKRFAAYSRDGLTIFGNSTGSFSVSNLRFDDISITGDLPSVDTTAGTVNGVSEQTIMQSYGVDYTRALPNGGGDVHGLNIKWGPGSSITDVHFRNVCIQDVETPLNIEPTSGGAATLNHISFDNVHVLPPNPQFLAYSGTQGGAAGSGRYDVKFQGFQDSQGNPAAAFVLSNVVFDDLPGGTETSMKQIIASYNKIGTVTNVYPAVFNQLDGAGSENPPPSLTIGGNIYSFKTSTSTPSLANPCNPSPRFVTGELYASAGNQTNLNVLTMTSGSAFTLNAVVQPIMSQTTFPMWGAQGNQSPDTVVEIGSPALTNAVRFYDGSRYIGSAPLSANGTLAALQINHVAPGLHIFTAVYPKDAFYSDLNFGLVAVKVVQPPLQ